MPYMTAEQMRHDPDAPISDSTYRAHIEAGWSVPAHFASNATLTIAWPEDAEEAKALARRLRAIAPEVGMTADEICPDPDGPDWR